jgi:multiple antibiotic resistance protein
MKEIVGFFTWVFVTFITLISIVNPLSTAILLLSISAQLSAKERNHQITLACIYMTSILVIFLLAGHIIMVAFGISIPGIRIAGGMVIGFLGFRMLFPSEGHISQEGKQEALQKSSISFTPLAMPSLSGPGAIATVITISSSIDGRHGYDKVFAFTGVVLAIVITAFVSWLVLRSAGFMRRILGVNGVDSLSRIMGFLLVCIGIQFAINGVRDLALDTEFWQRI